EPAACPARAQHSGRRIRRPTPPRAGVYLFVIAPWGSHSTGCSLDSRREGDVSANWALLLRQRAAALLVAHIGPEHYAIMVKSLVARLGVIRLGKVAIGHH